MATKTDTTTPAPATNDAYTGMLAISLCALIVGCVLLYLDYSQYPDSKAPAIPKAPPIAAPAQGQQEQPAAPKQDEAPAKEDAAPQKK
jgi:hypothetical protein